MTFIGSGFVGAGMESITRAILRGACRLTAGESKDKNTGEVQNHRRDTKEDGCFTFKYSTHGIAAYTDYASLSSPGTPNLDECIEVL